MAPAPLDDGTLASVIRSFCSGAKFGIKALQQEDAAYSDPAELAKFLHAHERILRLSIRAIFLDRGSDLSKQVLQEYGKLVDGREVPVGRVQGALESFAPVTFEASETFAILSGLLLFLFDPTAPDGGSRALRGVVCIAGATEQAQLRRELVSTNAADFGMAESSSTGRMFGVKDSDLVLLASDRASAAGVFVAPAPEDQQRWVSAIGGQLAPGDGTPNADSSFGGGSSEVVDGSSEDDFVYAGDLSTDSLAGVADTLDSAVEQAEAALPESQSADWTTGIDQSLTSMTSAELDDKFKQIDDNAPSAVITASNVTASGAVPGTDSDEEPVDMTHRKQHVSDDAPRSNPCSPTAADDGGAEDKSDEEPVDMSHRQQHVSVDAAAAVVDLGAGEAQGSEEEEEEDEAVDMSHRKQHVDDAAQAVAGAAPGKTTTADSDRDLRRFTEDAMCRVTEMSPSGAALPAPADVSAGSATVDVSALPAGWTESSGAPPHSFVNSITKRVTWDRPTEPATEEPADVIARATHTPPLIPPEFHAQCQDIGMLSLAAEMSSALLTGITTRTKSKNAGGVFSKNSDTATGFKLDEASAWAVAWLLENGHELSEPKQSADAILGVLRVAKVFSMVSDLPEFAGSSAKWGEFCSFRNHTDAEQLQQLIRVKIAGALHAFLCGLSAEAKHNLFREVSHLHGICRNHDAASQKRASLAYSSVWQGVYDLNSARTAAFTAGSDWALQQAVRTQFAQQLMAHTGGLFGVGLGHSRRKMCEHSKYVPVAIADIIGRIDLQHEGLFRINGSSAAVQGAIEKLNAGEDRPASFLSELQTEDLTDLFSKWVRMLPEPLLTDELALQFAGVCDSTRDEQTLMEKWKKMREAVRKLVRQLPEANQSALDFVVQFLGKVAAECEKTLMTAPNLAICWVQQLMGPALSDAMVGNPSVLTILNDNACLCVNILIAEHPYIFDHADTTEDLGPHESDEEDAEQRENHERLYAGILSGEPPSTDLALSEKGAADKQAAYAEKQPVDSKEAAKLAKAAAKAKKAEEKAAEKAHKKQAKEEAKLAKQEAKAQKLAAATEEGVPAKDPSTDGTDDSDFVDAPAEGEVSTPTATGHKEAPSASDSSDFNVHPEQSLDDTAPPMPAKSPFGHLDRSSETPPDGPGSGGTDSTDSVQEKNGEIVTDEEPAAAGDSSEPNDDVPAKDPSTEGTDDSDFVDALLDRSENSSENAGVSMLDASIANKTFPERDPDSDPRTDSTDFVENALDRSEDCSGQSVISSEAPTSTDITVPARDTASDLHTDESDFVAEVPDRSEMSDNVLVDDVGEESSTDGPDPASETPTKQGNMPPPTNGPTVRELRENAATIGTPADAIEIARDADDPVKPLQDLIAATEQEQAEVGLATEAAPEPEPKPKPEPALETAALPKPEPEPEAEEEEVARGVAQHAKEEAAPEPGPEPEPEVVAEATPQAVEVAPEPEVAAVETFVEPALEVEVEPATEAAAPEAAAQPAPEPEVAAEAAAAEEPVAKGLVNEEATPEATPAPEPEPKQEPEPEPEQAVAPEQVEAASEPEVGAVETPVEPEPEAEAQAAEASKAVPKPEPEPEPEPEAEPQPEVEPQPEPEPAPEPAPAPEPEPEPAVAAEVAADNSPEKIFAEAEASFEPKDPTGFW